MFYYTFYFQYAHKMINGFFSPQEICKLLMVKNS